jgi:hypothetical protein
VLELGGARERCKVSVLSRAQLARETSARARDLHHLGRFSKPIGLAWTRDAAARAAVLAAQLSSLQVLTPLALAELGDERAPESVVRAIYRLSYRAEPRVPEPRKVEAILAADPDYTRVLGELLVRAFAAAPLPPREQVAARIARARRRELVRWPIYLATFDGWLDYAMAKLERHTGAGLVLSPRQRRYPLVYGWPALLSLWRRGLLA